MWKKKKVEESNGIRNKDTIQRIRTRTKINEFHEEIEKKFKKRERGKLKKSKKKGDGGKYREEGKVGGGQMEQKKNKMGI